MARDHLLDALAALPTLDGLRPARVVDIGSGGGIPALPLALARPALSWTLIESVKGKAAFLADAARTLGLDRVTVARASAPRPSAAMRGTGSGTTSPSPAPAPRCRCSSSSPCRSCGSAARSSPGRDRSRRATTSCERGAAARPLLGGGSADRMAAGGTPRTRRADAGRHPQAAVRRRRATRAGRASRRRRPLG